MLNSLSGQKGFAEFFAPDPGIFLHLKHYIYIHYLILVVTQENLIFSKHVRLVYLSYRKSPNHF